MQHRRDALTDAVTRELSLAAPHGWIHLGADCVPPGAGEAFAVTREGWFGSLRPSIVRPERATADAFLRFRPSTIKSGSAI